MWPRAFAHIGCFPNLAHLNATRESKSTPPTPTLKEQAMTPTRENIVAPLFATAVWFSAFAWVMIRFA